MTADSWEIRNFEFKRHEWIFREGPSREWKRAALRWIKTIQVDPYACSAIDVELGAPWWVGVVHETVNDTHVLVCSFAMDVENGILTCSFFTKRELPLFLQEW